MSSAASAPKASSIPVKISPEISMKDETNQSKTKKMYKNGSIKSPVVGLQGDDKKIVCAYESGISFLLFTHSLVTYLLLTYSLLTHPGTITVWDVESGTWDFDIKGRNTLISSLQYDDKKIICDGTSSIIVSHDFSSPNGEANLKLDISTADDEVPGATG